MELERYAIISTEHLNPADVPWFHAVAWDEEMRYRAGIGLFGSGYIVHRTRGVFSDYPTSVEEILQWADENLDEDIMYIFLDADGRTMPGLTVYPWD